MKVKTKTLNIRVEQPLFDFITDTAKQIGLDRSEMVRRILEFHFLELFLEKLPKQNLKEMRKSFKNKYFRKELNDEALNKYGDVI